VQEPATLPDVDDILYYESVIAAQGAEFRGIQTGPRGDLILFADPQLRSTLAVAEVEFSPRAVSCKLEESRHSFRS
jgi:hypothetical protein